MDDVAAILAPPTDDELNAIIDRLQNSIRTWKGNATYRRSIEIELHIVLQCRRLDLGMRAIRRAALAGDVCNDVAWFDTITTLYDYCCILLNDDVALSAITARAYPHPTRRPKTQATPPKRRPQP